ncbi:MAG: DNA alkylation repair protein [Sphingomonas sp.]|nr:DNA alkylation repair protein [Sphingomonas sp.]
MARFGIVTAQPAMGMRVDDIRAVARAAGRDHALALQLWDAGWYETRLLACFVADPRQVTPELMDAWAGDFDNWATCDTACFDLFDRTPHALAKVRQWAADEREFVRRAAFALLASVALHVRTLPDAELRALLPLIEAADDNRNFVRKGVSWALRAIGGKRAGLHAECVAVAGRMAASAGPAKRWVGKDALRDLQRPLVLKRLGL